MVVCVVVHVSIYMYHDSVFVVCKRSYFCLPAYFSKQVKLWFTWSGPNIDQLVLGKCLLWVRHTLIYLEITIYHRNSVFIVVLHLSFPIFFVIHFHVCCFNNCSKCSKFVYRHRSHIMKTTNCRTIHLYLSQSHVWCTGACIESKICSLCT